MSRKARLRVSYFHNFIDLDTSKHKHKVLTDITNTDASKYSSMLFKGSLKKFSQMRLDTSEQTKSKSKGTKHSRNNQISSSKPSNTGSAKRKSSIKCQNYMKVDHNSTTSSKLIHTARVNLSQISPNRFEPTKNVVKKHYGYLGGSHQRINSQRSGYSKIATGGSIKHSVVDHSKVHNRTKSELKTHKNTSKTGSNKRKKSKSRDERNVTQIKDQILQYLENYIKTNIDKDELPAAVYQERLVILKEFL